MFLLNNSQSIQIYNFKCNWSIFWIFNKKKKKIYTLEKIKHLLPRVKLIYGGDNGITVVLLYIYLYIYLPIFQEQRPMWCKKCGLLTAIKDAFMVSTDRLHTAHIPRHNLEL